MHLSTLRLKFPCIDLVFLSILSVLVRIPGIQRLLWKDELITLSTLSVNIIHNPLLFGTTTNLPLFFYVLKFVGLFINPVNLWLFRIIPIVFNVGTILVLFLFLKKIFGGKVAWICAFLLCFSPIQIYYAQELRPYSLVQFLIVLNFTSLYLFLTQNRAKYLVTFAISSFLVVVTHFTGYYFLFAEGLVVLFILIKQRFLNRNTVKAFVVFILAGCIGLVLLVLMKSNPAFIKSLKLLEIGGPFKLTNGPLGETYLALSRIKEVVSFYYWFGLYYFSVDPIVQFIFKKVILVLVFLGAFFAYKGRRSKEVLVLAPVFFILLVSLAFAYVGEKLGYFPFGGRHVMPYSVFLYIVIAYVLSKLRVYGGILLVLLIVLFISFQFCYTYGILPSEVFTTIPAEIYKACYTRLF